ncbi:GMC oxidoreductase [Nonomuraea sp. CA-141351]|uniref:GMC oxidoreductase n=1 Tax=Nonomuraea sp. CA-141351 TaxID=3239996 RepID=UPI003D8DF030
MASQDGPAAQLRHLSRVGTCAMGDPADPASVVAPDCAVLGVSGLSMVDASVMRRIPRGNTNLPTFMVAERAADLVAANLT